MSKDQSSTPEAEYITSLTTTDRRCSVANKQHHTGPYAHTLTVCVVECLEFWEETKRDLVLISPRASKASAFISGLLSYAVLGSSNTCPNLDQRRMGSGVRALSVVGWRTTQIWCCGSKKQGVICQCMDTLKGMCVHCLWVSQSFFCSRLFEDNLHSRKIDSLFFVLVSTVLQGRTLCLKGYY